MTHLLVIARSISFEAIHLYSVIPRFAKQNVKGSLRHCEVLLSSSLQAIRRGNPASLCHPSFCKAKRQGIPLSLRGTPFLVIASRRRGNPFPTILDCFTFVRNDTPLSTIPPLPSVIASRRRGNPFPPL